MAKQKFNDKYGEKQDGFHILDTVVQPFERVYWIKGIFDRYNFHPRIETAKIVGKAHTDYPSHLASVLNAENRTEMIRWEDLCSDPKILINIVRRKLEEYIKEENLKLDQALENVTKTVQNLKIQVWLDKKYWQQLI